MKKLDEVLRQALIPANEPDFWLNQRILNRTGEKSGMEKKRYKKIAAAVLSAVLVMGVGSATVYAAWKYLTPDKVAEKFEQAALSEAFQGKEAVAVNETQSFGGYDVTLLGVVSGKNLSKFEMISNGHISNNKTYAVAAIQNRDGTKMPETSEEAYGKLSFFASPLIEAYDPARYNAVTMYGGYQDMVIDGVLYRLAECDNVEWFADHTLYFCVSDGSFYNQEAYCFNEETGEITRNEAYEGLNALFVLPIDKEKADKEEAEKYLESLFLSQSAERAEIKEEGAEAEKEEQAAFEENEVEKWMYELTPENIEERAVCVESTRQILVPDENGMVSYSYELNERGAAEGSCAVSAVFEEGELGMSKRFSFHYSQKGLASLAIETFTRNQDGTITFAVYIPKE